MIARVHAEIVKAGRRQDVQERLPDCTYILSTPQEFAATISREVDQWLKLVKSAGIKVQ